MESGNSLSIKANRGLIMNMRWLWIFVCLVLLILIIANGYEKFNNWNRQRLLAKAIKAVATITTSDKDRNPLNQGSGVFINYQNRKGLLITNYHVIKGADIPNGIEAKFASGAFYKLKNIEGENEALDIAILQFDATDTPMVDMPKQLKLKKGEEVVAIGSPIGLDNSLSNGIIANPIQNINGKDLIQFTAPISEGSSGGGLFNIDGQIIGLTCSSIEASNAQNVNFAIPIDLVRNVLNGSEKNLTEDSAAYYYAQGKIADNNRDYDKAILDYNKALSIDKYYLSAYKDLGGVYYIRGNYDQEVANYLKATQIDPKNCEAFSLLATAYEDSKQFDKAIDSYKHALAIKPDDKDSLFYLILESLAHGNSSEAKSLLQQLQQLDQGESEELQLLMNRIR